MGPLATALRAGWACGGQAAPHASTEFWRSGGSLVAARDPGLLRAASGRPLALRRARGAADRLVRESVGPVATAKTAQIPLRQG